MNRRSFLKWSGFAAIGAVASRFLPKVETRTAPLVEWADRYRREVIVSGSPLSGDSICNNPYVLILEAGEHIERGAAVTIGKDGRAYNARPNDRFSLISLKETKPSPT